MIICSICEQEMTYTFGPAIKPVCISCWLGADCKDDIILNSDTPEELREYAETDAATHCVFEEAMQELARLFLPDPEQSKG
jgi:hypothetical protein